MASALALAPRTTAGLTVLIKGTCVEAVNQVPGNVTLQGASSGDGLQAPDASGNPVLGIGGAGVTLDNLTISGGVNALLVRSGGTAVGNNLEIEGSSSQNVLAQGVLTLNSSTIEAWTHFGHSHQIFAPPEPFSGSPPVGQILAQFRPAVSAAMTGGVPERDHDVTRYSHRAVTIVDAARLGGTR